MLIMCFSFRHLTNTHGQARGFPRHELYDKYVLRKKIIPGYNKYRFKREDIAHFVSNIKSHIA